MIRAATPADLDAIVGLAVSSGLFPPDGLDEMRGLTAAALAGEAGPDQLFFLGLASGDDPSPVGVAYVAPEPLADRVWNLLLLAVDAARQGEGRGAALVRHVEAELTGRGARLLLIETSGVDGFEAQRAFYRGLGYGGESRVRDYYADGDDRVTFAKRLASA